METVSILFLQISTNINCSPIKVRPNKGCFKWDYLNRSAAGGKESIRPLAYRVASCQSHVQITNWKLWTLEYFCMWTVKKESGEFIPNAVTCKKKKKKNQCYKSICIIVSNSGSIQFKSGFQFIIKKKKKWKSLWHFLASVVAWWCVWGRLETLLPINSLSNREIWLFILEPSSADRDMFFMVVIPDKTQQKNHLFASSIYVKMKN